MQRGYEVTVMSMNIAAHTALRRSSGRRRPGRAPSAGGRARPEASRWDDRVAVVDALAETPGFRRLRDQLITLADLSSADRVLDVGAGTGLISLAAAERAAQVIAIDISEPMCDTLRRRVATMHLTNVDVRRAGATDLSAIPDASIDVVVSNYCLHHLTDEHKRRALAELGRVLRPGGRLVIGDMMFRIGVSTPRDRSILTTFVVAQLKRGPAGLVRLARNAGRLLTGRTEYPASVEWWAAALRDAGFIDVRSRALTHEGGIALGRRPGLLAP